MKSTGRTGSAVDPATALPPLSRQASTASDLSQRHFLWTTRSRLGLLVITASTGLYPWKTESGVDASAIVAAIAFGVVALLEVHLLQSRPERSWYRARALAESVKTLAWRYMVRGRPFASDDELRDRFLERFDALRGEAKDVALVPTDGPAEPITDAMTTARAADFERRKQLYLDGRIDDQISWYGGRSRSHRLAAIVWSSILVVASVVGLVASILKASGSRVHRSAGVRRRGSGVRRGVDADPPTRKPRCGLLHGAPRADTGTRSDPACDRRDLGRRGGERRGGHLARAHDVAGRTRRALVSAVSPS